MDSQQAVQVEQSLNGSFGGLDCRGESAPETHNADGPVLLRLLTSITLNIYRYILSHIQTRKSPFSSARVRQTW